MSYETDARTVAAARRLWSLNSSDTRPWSDLPKPHRTDLLWQASLILAAADSATTLDEHAEQAMTVVAPVVPKALPSRVPLDRLVRLEDLPTHVWEGTED